MKKFYKVKSEKETTLVAARIAKTLRGGDVIALEGELGAGKTTFVRGLARAFGIRARVTSPTFLLMRCYSLPRAKVRRGIRHLCHVDAYRVRGASALQEIGIAEHLASPDTVTLIEWAERVEKLLPANAIRVHIRYGKKSSERAIEISR
jgi:tRNA threonylcarbamoyladenosine biosynthesis protein TsaE